MIPVLRPSYTQAEKDAVATVLDSGWSGLGPKVEEFEDAWAKHLGVKHAVATNSGTAALHLALRLVGVSQGGAVLVPSLTFVSTAHVVDYLGATPLFCDIDRSSLCTTGIQISERGSRRNYGNIEAAMVVLYAGQPVDVGRRLIPVVYDCAHAAGSTFDARGKLCCWSFHAVKNISTGEGGMLTTDDTVLAERARRLRWMGISTSTYQRNYLGTEGVAYSERPAYKWEYDCEEIGYKANMHDISAAIGLVQLQRLTQMQHWRCNLVSCYWAHLNGLDAHIKPIEHTYGSSYHLMVVRCENRNGLHAYLRERGISTGVHYKPIHLYACYGYQEPLPVVETEWLKLLTLPLYFDLTREQVAMICDHIRDFYALEAR
jgi:dTDP-4-amino-4,6-dideoxygalactose transaminase